MLSLVIGILSGLICAAPFIISKVPSLEPHLAKVVPFAGWIGVSVLFWGVFELTGLDAAAEEARRRLAEHLDKLDAAAKRFEEKVASSSRVPRLTSAG